MTEQRSASVHSVVVGDPGADRRVAFLHGLFGRGKNFNRIAAGLRPEAQSLLIDLPDHGQSEWTAGVSYSEYADRIAQHLREGFAANGPVDVVGHSMGGKVAMILALQHPELLRRLTIIDIAPTAADSSQEEFEHLLGALASLDLATISSRAEADAALREPIPEAGVRGFLLQNLKRGDDGFVWEPNLDLLRAELDAVTGFPDMSGAEFSGPVLWMGGDESDYVTDEDEPAMRALFPRTIRMTVRGAGHWVHSEKPDETIAALRSFLLR